MTGKRSRWKIILFALPFVIGTTGYLVAGETVTDSLYSSIALYGMSPISDAFNVWIEIARWTAPLATATALLYAFTKLLAYFRWRIGCIFHDSVAVYTDSDIKISFGDKTREIYSADVRRPAKSHIILMKNDTDCFDFYDKNRDSFKNRNVYIGLHEMELGLLKENPDISYFDINGTISRLLWKEIKLWNRHSGSPIKVVIWGSGALAESILSHGLLLNIFSPMQHIRYVMAGDDAFHIKHPELQLMNNDEIIYLQKDSEMAWSELSNADIVIVADETSASAFQMIAVRARNAAIYYYSRHKRDVGEIISLGTITAFGRDADIYTDECIRQEKLIAEAKKMNQSYAEKYGGVADWGKLSGFLKWSNISSADYIQVLKDVIANNPSLDDDVCAELEHIRWCRFHYLNYWKYGIPESGRPKDAELRIHSCLKPYNELSEEDKDKDKAVVTEARGLIIG